MKSKKILIACLIIIGLIVLVLIYLNSVGSLSFLNQPLNNLIAGSPDKSCNSDSDCVIKTTTCNICDCGDAVNKNWHSFCPFLDKSIVRCKICTFPSDFGIKCIEGQCQARVIGPCSPCFSSGSAIAYIDHSANTLLVRVGPSEISNSKVIVGGTSVSGTPASNPPGTDITFTSTGLFAGDVDITVQYTLVSSGLMHTQTATLHGAS